MTAPSRTHVTQPRGACDSHCHIFGPFDRFALPNDRSFNPHETPETALRALHDHLGIDRAVIVQSQGHGLDHAALLDALALATLALPAAAQELTRHPIPNSDFPILQAVEVPAGMTTVYLSGTVPAVINEDAEPGSVEAFGNTEEQTVSVMTRIQSQLESLGMDVGDIIKMQAFLVAPEGEAVDFDGFMAGYRQFFGTEEQPNLPVRSAMVVEALVNPAWLVELEVTAVRP